MANSAENIGINTETDVTNVESNNQSEVVYKPTTLELSEAHLWKQKFQSLEPEKPEVFKDSLKLYLVAFTAFLLPFGTAVGFSWTSPVFPKLTGPENPLNAPVDSFQKGVIASILSIGAIIGPFAFGRLADIKGRKKALLSLAATLILSFTILAFATDVRFYYLARFIQGIASGSVFVIITMYIAEITENHNRGKFSCYSGIFVALGILYPFLIGPHLTVRVFTLTCTVPLLIFIALFTLLCPESPLFLAKIGDQQGAEKALEKLRYRKSKNEIIKEYLEMREIAEREKLQTGGASTLFFTSNLRNSTFTISILFVFQQLVGINVVLGFLETIFASAGGAIPPNYATVLVGVIQVLTMIVTSVLVERLGRKFLVLVAFVGCIVCLLLLGSYFYLKQNNYDTLLAHLWWVPIFSLLAYIIMFNIGLGPGPWIILSETFPANVKSLASAFCSASAFLSAFCVTLGFPILNESLGMSFSFWVFAGFSIFGLAFTYFVVPETKGMSIEEIQKYFGAI